MYSKVFKYELLSRNGLDVVKYHDPTSLTNYIHKASKVKKNKRCQTRLARGNKNPSQDISVIASSSSSSSSQLPVVPVPENVST